MSDCKVLAGDNEHTLKCYTHNRTATYICPVRLESLQAELEAFKAQEARGNEECGYCAKCMTTIWGRDGHFIENDGRKYHAVCKVALRAEAAETQNAILVRTLEDISSRRCCDDVCHGPCASERAADALKASDKVEPQ